MLDPGNLPGKTASLDFGEQTELERERKAIQSAGSPQAPPGAPPVGGAPPGAPAGGPPVQPAPMQPGIPQQQGRPIDASIDMNNLFQRAPQLQEPYRTWLRRQASRPGAGPEMRALADAIDYQRGPLDEKPGT